MRLIISRKGFDSSAGGCPSPIFPDGSFYALPIPDTNANIRYAELNFAGHDLGALVEDLTRGKCRAAHTAHLDPDIHASALPRQPRWRPLLGQTGAAQGHLRRQGVEVGDLFLFFGLFRSVERVDGCWRYVKDAPARHILWGWLAVGEIVNVDSLRHGELPWARYHPHFTIGPDAANTLYISAERLSLGSDLPLLAGAGVFRQLSQQLELTHPDSPRPSSWKLPRFLYPAGGRTPLSYHTKRDRWSVDKEGLCRLQSAARGQEFVLNMREYPQVGPWLAELIHRHGS